MESPWLAMSNSGQRGRTRLPSGCITAVKRRVMCFLQTPVSFSIPLPLMICDHAPLYFLACPETIGQRSRRRARCDERRDRMAKQGVRTSSRVCVSRRPRLRSSLWLGRFSRRTVRRGLRLLLGELVVVLYFVFEPIQLRFKSPPGRPGPDRSRGVQLVRIVDQVVALPLVLLPEIDQLVRLGADAVMGPRVVVARIVVIAIVPALPPVGRPLALDSGTKLRPCMSAGIFSRRSP